MANPEPPALADSDERPVRRHHFAVLPLVAVDRDAPGPEETAQLVPARARQPGDEGVEEGAAGGHDDLRDVLGLLASREGAREPVVLCLRDVRTVVAGDELAGETALR